MAEVIAPAPRPSTHERRSGSKRSFWRTGTFWIATAPLWINILAFAIVALVYQLGWSMLYPPLSIEITAFLVITSSVSFLLIFVEWVAWKEPPPVKSSWWTHGRVRGVAVLIYLFVFVELINNGGVPIVLIFTGAEYDYRNFGIPTLHVVMYGAYWFLCVHWFYLWLVSGCKYYLGYAVLLLAINLLLVNRGALIQALLAWGVIFLVHRGVSLRALLGFVLGLAMFVWVFGSVGDARMKSMGMDPNHTILAIGDASEKYPVDELGTGPFWIYLYASSPLANWQLNVTEPSAHGDWWTFVVCEVMPDFIGKHFRDNLISNASPKLIASSLTVASAYGRAYYLKGWVGATLVYCLLIIYHYFSRSAFRRSEYFFSGVAVLSSGAALMIFDNMLAFTGLVGPLLVAVVLRFALRSKNISTGQWRTSAKELGA